jgi:hypothetical protein
MVYWDDLGFDTNFTIDADLEYPGDDAWSHPRVLVGDELGAGPIAEIAPAEDATWLLAADLTGVTGLYGCPDPDAVCLVTRGVSAVLVGAARPHTQTRLNVTPTRVAAAHEPSLLLFTEIDSVSASKADGTRLWRSKAIALDLHILRTDNGRIVCRGFGLDGSTTVVATLDAASGAFLEGGPLAL